MSNKKNLDKKIEDLEKAVLSLRENRDTLLKELQRVKDRTRAKITV